MESRRDFLRHATVTLLLVPLGAAACSGDNNSTSAVTGTTNTGGCDGISATSTVVGGHSHTVCVSLAALTNPPAGGMTFTTSVSQSHQHTINLSPAQLKVLAAGGEVTVETSLVLSHSHEFMLIKMGTIEFDAGAVRIDGGAVGTHAPSGGTGGGSSSGGPSGGRGY